MILYDRKRHLICLPYSVPNLHAMAQDLGIKRCWYHSSKFPHYDIPKTMLAKVAEVGTLVSPREILRIIKENL